MLGRDALSKRTLAATDLNVSRISLGCWTIGGPNFSGDHPSGWTAVEEKEAIGAIHYAIDHGVNHFDNADVYGNGAAERLLAKALHPCHSKLIISSKVGHFKGTAAHSYDYHHIISQCEQSLRNLKRDSIDLYYFHHGNFGPDDLYLPEALEAFEKLKRDGKIRYIGLSAYSTADFVRLVPKIKPDVLQTWANTLDDRFIRKGSVVSVLCRKQKRDLIAFSPLAQGLLLDKFDPESPPRFAKGDVRSSQDKFSPQNLSRIHQKLQLLKAEFGPDQLLNIALQYVLHHPTVGAVLAGFRNREQVEQILAADSLSLSEGDVEKIRTIMQNT